MKKEEAEKILKDLEKLSPKAQDAFWWMIINKKVVKELCKGPKMSEEKIKTLSDIALEKEDYITYALIQFKKYLDSKGENS